MITARPFLPKTHYISNSPRRKPCYGTTEEERKDKIVTPVLSFEFLQIQTKFDQILIQN